MSFGENTPLKKVAFRYSGVYIFYEDEKLFLSIYIMDIQNMFDTYFVVPFGYYFMSFVPTYSAAFNCQSTIMEMLLAKENKRMCEHLSYSVPVSLTATSIANIN